MKILFLCSCGVFSSPHRKVWSPRVTALDVLDDPGHLTDAHLRLQPRSKTENYLRPEDRLQLGILR